MLSANLIKIFLKNAQDDTKSKAHLDKCIVIEFSVQKEVQSQCKEELLVPGKSLVSASDTLIRSSALYKLPM